MAVKTFAVGELVSADDVNAYMANPGLDYVKSQTIGSAVSNVEVTGAFAADWVSYLVVVAGGTSSTTGSLRLTFGASTSTYYWGSVITTYATSAITGGGGSNVAFIDIGGMRTTNVSAYIEIVNPFLARPTLVRAFDSNTTDFRQYGGYHNVSTSYTSFKLTTSTGTLTGGEITVYGNRTA